MRVLLACSLGGLGHLTPVTAVARAARRRGHETIVLVPPSLADAIGRTDLEFALGGDPPRAFVDEIWSRVRAGPPDAVAGLIDRELFAGRCLEAMLGPARGLRDSWRPDVIVREPCEYASAVAAHEAAIAQVQVGISLAQIEWNVLGMVAAAIERRFPGAAASVREAPYLTAFPATLDPSPWPETHRYREPDVSASAPPQWWSRFDERPLVYVTFGSVIGHLPEATGAFRAAVDALADLPVRALLTIGRASDPAALGAVPDNVRVERWVPQRDVLPHAAAVVCHGGSGTIVGALSAGVPLVVCPLFADQLRNGRLVEDAGAGLLVEAAEPAAGGLRRIGHDDVPAIRSALARVLAEPQFRRAARRVADEIAGIATLDEVVAGLLG